MSDTITSSGDFDERGRFLPGNTVSRLGGRPKGARSKLGEQFILDLADVWAERGKQALLDCATTKPAEFVRVVASLLPQQASLDVNLFADSASFAEAFQLAAETVGAATTPRLPKGRLLELEATFNADG